MRVGEIKQFCKLQNEGGVLSLSKYQSLMRAAMTQLDLSARAYHRILKLARMIADLTGSDETSNPRIWRRRCNIDRVENGVDIFINE